MKLDTQYKAICEALLHAESEDEVTKILEDHGLLAISHWKLLGDMPNNRAMVNNQAQDATGALVEKVVNGIDAMLIMECFLGGVAPDSTGAPPTMAAAAERFFKVRDGNLANIIISRERTRLADNIQLIAVGSKSDPCYLVVDKGEGQTPARFEDTFLSLVKTNKARIPFVQGRFNCGGTGVLPFCGRKAYQLIISRRCPSLPSDPSRPTQKDSTHHLWGFTLIRVVPPSESLLDTTAYMYLAPDGQIPQFENPELFALPEVTTEAIGDESDDEETGTGKPTGGKANPKPYRVGLKHGTVVKLYSYRWKARSLATRDARRELERYLFHLSLPVRVVESRSGFTANYFATTVSGTSVTIALDQEKGFLEDDFPLGGTLNMRGIGKLPISITLYRERGNDEENDQQDKKDKKQKAKAAKRLPKGLYFTINGQVHYSLGPEFFRTRGLNYEFLKDTLLATVDCNGLSADIQDQLIMPSRDRLRKIPEFEDILSAIADDLKDRPALRAINDARSLRRVKEALSQEAVQDVFQTLINKDPVFASLFQNGKGLRKPSVVVPPRPPYKGKLPPTYFRFENGGHEITKSFAIDRTCAVELKTDAVKGYFELPNPVDRGELRIEPECYERWNLSNGCLRIVFRAPSNARISDSLPVKVTVTDPCLKARGDQPWLNLVVLRFVPGGKEAKPGTHDPKPKGEESLGLPDVVPVHKAQWDDHHFNERSALRVVRKEGGAYQFFVNMDNTYLHNELMRRKDLEKDTVTFAFRWGLVLVSLGMLTEMDRQKKPCGEEESINTETTGLSPEDKVGQFSAGIAAVIVPTVLDLMALVKVGTPQKQLEAAVLA